MTRLDKATVAAVCIACGYAALVGLIVTERAITNRRKPR